jgi:protoporphyrinogen/coproporphyrinogen III oxidase
MRILVLGAGISGLSLAYFLKNAGHEVIVLEKESRPGGWIRTQEGFELGPRSLRSQEAVALCQELGVPLIAADKSASKRFLFHGGELHRIPKIPFRALPDIFRERNVPVGTSEDETIANFFERRFGERITQRYIDPVTLGIYAGNIDTLSMRSCYPRIWRAEKRFGSVVRGRKFLRTGATLCAPRDGMEALPRALAHELGPSLKLGQQVLRIGEGVETDQGSWEGDLIISTLPAHTLSRLVEDGALSGLLREFQSNSVGIACVRFDSDVLVRRGFGYLVPSSEGEDLLGMVWDSSTFPQHNKTESETRLTLMFRSLDELEKRSLEILQRHLSITEEPDTLLTHRAEQAIPQYSVGHHERLAGLEKYLAEAHPVFRIAGSSFHGVSIGDCISNSRVVGKSIIQ